jgi:pimeloyl-ACP methyl ester carboxylesterase
MPDDPGNRPVIVGASLGGLAAMLVAGGADRDLLSGLVLVDITPRMDSTGVEKITGFMQARAEDGYASVEEAAGAVAAYLPNRQRPISVAGLMKNLRQTPEGRYIWHWDPRFLTGDRAIDAGKPDTQRRLEDAVRKIRVPTMLVRGSRSELVNDDHVAGFSELAPHAEIADVRGAGHMVVGDRNDLFADAIEGFLQRHFRSADGGGIA